MKKKRSFPVVTLFCKAVVGCFLALLLSCGDLPVASQEAFVFLSAEGAYKPPVVDQYDLTQKNKQYLFTLANPLSMTAFSASVGITLDNVLIEKTNYILSYKVEGTFLEAYDLTNGKQLWSELVCPKDVDACDFEFQVEEASLLFNPDHSIYVIGHQKNGPVIKAINGKNGTALWNAFLDDISKNYSLFFKTDEQSLYIFYRPDGAPANITRVLVLDRKDGKRSSIIDIPVSFRQASIQNGILYFTGFDGTHRTFYAFNMHEKTFLQHLTFKFALEKGPYQWVIDSEHLYLKLQSELRAVNLSDGKQTWTHTRWFADFTNHSLELFHNEIFTTAMKGQRLYLSVLDKNTGKELWQKEFGNDEVTYLKEQVEPQLTILLVTEGALYIFLNGTAIQGGTQKELIVALEKQSGQEIWCRSLLTTDQWGSCEENLLAVHNEIFP